MVTLLVTGGSGRIEIIRENHKTEVCNNMPWYPNGGVSRAAGSTWNDGRLSICGGTVYQTTSMNNCYSLENGQWKENKNNLKMGRHRHAASNIGTNIWFSGGYNGQNNWRLSSTEIMHQDGKITSGPNLPEARSIHCQISYEDTTFVIGKCIIVAKKTLGG